MASATTKQECEALLSSVLPLAEQLLSEQRVLRPLGSTLSASDQITHLDGVASGDTAQNAAHIAEFEASFRDGAQRGELKATALLYSSSTLPPGASAAQQVVLVHLDHRDDYSIVVTFPYRFTEAGQLLIDEPFAAEGAHGIFRA